MSADTLIIGRNSVTEALEGRPVHYQDIRRVGQ